MRTGEARLNREWTVALVVLAAALLYKLIYLVYYARQMPFYAAPTGDSAIYLDWARAIAYGDFWGLREPFRVFYRAPLYPYVLALFLRLFGGSLLPVYLFQILLGVFNLLLVYLITRKLFSHWAGVAAVALAALYMPLSFKETKIVSITIVITFLLLAVWFLLRAVRVRPTAPHPESAAAAGREPRASARWSWLLAGLFFGLSALAWGGAVLLLPLAFLFWFVRRRQVKPVCFILLFLGWFAAITPAALHNLLVGNDFVLVSANTGYTFYQGNNPAASGTIVHPPEVYEQTLDGRYLTGIGDQQFFDMGYAARAIQRDSIKPSEASGFWMRRGLSWIARNPGHYLRLEFQKLVLLLSNQEFASNYFPMVELHQVPVLRFAFVPFALILAFGVLGMLFGSGKSAAGERRPAWPLYMVMLASALLLLIFYVGTRYRLPLVLPLSVFAGAGIVRLVERWRLRQVGYVELAVVALVLVISWIFCYVPLAERQAFVTALGYRNLGESYHRQLGNLGRAKRAYDRALGLHEESNYFGRTVLATDALAEVLTLRGDVYFDAGLFDSAAGDYRRARAVEPQRTQPVSRLALAFHTKATRMLAPGSAEQVAALDTALGYAREWRRTDSLNAATLALEGDIYLARADTNQALATYHRLLAEAPRFAPASLVLADIYLARKDTARAETVLAGLTQADSLNVAAWLVLADLIEHRGDSARALALYEHAAGLDTFNLAPPLRLASFYSRRKAWEKVKETASGATDRVEKPGVRITPRSPALAQYLELKLRLAAAHLNLGEWDRAKRQTDDVLKLAPGNPTALQLRHGAESKKAPEFILW